MPRSMVSSVGSSAGSRRAKTRQYYTVSKTSNVDESLFATKPHPAQRQRSAPELTTDTFSGTHNKKNRHSSRKGKEEVQVITKDLIRKLVVPKEDPSGMSVILPQSEYMRILLKSRVLSEDEKNAEYLAWKKHKQEIQETSAAVKNHLQALDKNKKRNEKLNELEEEAQKQAEYLLERAREQREEQEDDIKHLNELILNAKCHAIRDAQLLEKEQIKTEMSEEERRLDQMMEIERQNALILQEEIENQRKVERYEGAAKVLKQIAQREEDRLLEQEKKDQEAQQMLRYLEKLQMEDITELERKRKIQLESQQEIKRANEEQEGTKMRKVEQERLADLKVIEYQKQKAEREAKFEAEQELKRIEKEKEIARLRAMQERAKDYQAEKDALRAKRNQEQREREWRQKERETAIKQAENEQMLKVARELQVRNKEHFLAVQAKRERAEFERVLNAQHSANQKEKEKESETHERQRAYAESVRKQIREKEVLKINEKNAFFEEGIKINQEARERRAKLDAIKQKKLSELRAVGVPDKYCAEVARRIDAPVVTL
ncbi:cilia- and flagella-associated protein 45-like [Anneissia japonica]|uniref:cilia- and flagella-associated protein 45-like n=1 Tax=Anneissia japonica TaxID=1529436 RepID=UPI0014259B95|nr:cilia- and flagella-associated protein 45-like [Anneissia japonica]